MTHNERIESALRSPDPRRALDALVVELVAEGCHKPEIYALLEECLRGLRAREHHRQCDEDAVLDVMDALAGWCHPDAELLPGQNVT